MTSDPAPDFPDAATLARWRELCERATPGPWAICVGLPGIYADLGNGRSTQLRFDGATPDKQFIAAARMAVPALLAALERVTGERDAARAACEQAKIAIAYDGCVGQHEFCCSCRAMNMINAALAGRRPQEETDRG